MQELPVSSGFAKEDFLGVSTLPGLAPKFIEVWGDLKE